MEKLNSKKMVHIALLIAIEIILSRFFSISTPIVKIGFAFLPLCMVAMLYGPVMGGLAGGIADFLGAILFPIGPYFPGFTLTNALTGVVYGIMLHKQPKSWVRIIAAVLIIGVALDIGLNTVWLSVIMNKGYLGLMPARILKSLILVPIQIFVIRFAGVRLAGFGRKVTPAA